MPPSALDFISMFSFFARFQLLLSAPGSKSPRRGRRGSSSFESFLIAGATGLVLVSGLPTITAELDGAFTAVDSGFSENHRTQSAPAAPVMQDAPELQQAPVEQDALLGQKTPAAAPANANGKNPKGLEDKAPKGKPPIGTGKPPKADPKGPAPKGKGKGKK